MHARLLPPLRSAAGMILSFMPAEDTFFMLVTLMKDPLYGLAEMYAPGLLRFHEVGFPVPRDL